MTEQPQPVKLAFLGAEAFEDKKAWRGGILITDDATTPLEFRCTDPVRPTTLQSHLYGKELLTHIFVELFGVPLIRSITVKPLALALVNDEAFLDLSLKVAPPLVLLTRHGEGGKAPVAASASESPLLTSEGGRFEPIMMRIHRKRQDTTDEVRQMLTPIFATRNLIEPFERVRLALQEVHRLQAKK